MKILLLLSGLLMPVMSMAASPDLSFQPDDPASWNAQRPVTSEPVSPADHSATRWSAQGITRSIDEQQQREEADRAWQKKQDREKAARNPLCSESNREQIFSDNSRSDSRHRQRSFSQTCPQEGLSFSFGE